MVTACYSFLASKLLFFGEGKLQRSTCELHTVLIPHARDLDNLKCTIKYQIFLLAVLKQKMLLRGFTCFYPQTGVNL